MEKLGIDNLKELTRGLASFCNFLGGVFEDGSFGLSDFVHLPDLVLSVQSFAGVDYSDVLPEIDDLDAWEIDELSELFKEVFSIDNLPAEKIVELGLEYVLQGLESVFNLLTLPTKVDGL